MLALEIYIYHIHKGNRSVCYIYNDVARHLKKCDSLLAFQLIFESTPQKDLPVLLVFL